MGRSQHLLCVSSRDAPVFRKKPCCQQCLLRFPQVPQELPAYKRGVEKGGVRGVRSGANPGGGAYLLSDLGQILSLMSQHWLVPSLCTAVCWVLEKQDALGETGRPGETRCCVSLGRLLP